MSVMFDKDQQQVEGLGWERNSLSLTQKAPLADIEAEETELIPIV
jgi:hypothetical protein